MAIPHTEIINLASLIIVLILTAFMVGPVRSIGARSVALCELISTPTTVSLELRPIGTVIIFGFIVMCFCVSHNVTVTTARLIPSPDIGTNPDTTRPFVGPKDSGFC
jgi:hypothetical protein